MISQIYLDYTHNFFNSFINDPPFDFEFYIGAVETYKVIEDKNNCFISLGGDPSTPELLEDVLGSVPRNHRVDHLSGAFQSL